MKFTLIAAVVLMAVVVNGAIPQHEISSLPGWEKPFLSKMYSGYINITSDKALFYWFIESENDPSTDPVVLWTNGGPGCSSLDGLFYEHGPYHFVDNKGQNLEVNPFRWTKKASMLYLVHPAGVGMSYSNNPSDYHTGDKQDAEDNHKFLLNWFSQYSEFGKNKFFISGESYAGYYVPLMAQQVLLGNQAGLQPHINLVSTLSGNPCSDNVADGNAFVPFVYGHNFISNEQYEKIDSVCHGNYWNATSACNNVMQKELAHLGDVNMYNVYSNCFNGQKPQFTVEEMKDAKLRVKNYREQVPCIDSTAAEEYLNRPEVRTAIHAQSIAQIGKWSICSAKVQYKTQYDSMMPIYHELIENNIRALIYSGDVDLSVPNTGTQVWVSRMGLKMISPQPYTAWYFTNEQGTQVGGQITDYEGLRYVTVRGSGHMVPQFRPQQAEVMFMSWLDTFKYE